MSKTGQGHFLSSACSRQVLRCMSSDYTPGHMHRGGALRPRSPSALWVKVHPFSQPLPFPLDLERTFLGIRTSWVFRRTKIIKLSSVAFRCLCRVIPVVTRSCLPITGKMFCFKRYKTAFTWVQDYIFSTVTFAQPLSRPSRGGSIDQLSIVPS